MVSQPARRSLLLLLWSGLAVATASFSLSACTRSEPASAAREDKLVVFAAASLREVFTALGDSFKRSRPGVTITFNFAGTQELRTQLAHGAPVDVFASADQRHIEELVRTSRATNPVVFVRNEPVLVVSKESTATLKSLRDLPNAARIVIGTPEVPIGRYSLQILERARAQFGADFAERVQAKVVSRELNVRQVLTKVSLGEAQAGIVYRTDAAAAKGGLGIVSIPPDINVIAEYPIAVVTGAAHPKLARAWVDFVLSAEGQRALQGAGFLAAAGDQTTP